MDTNTSPAARYAALLTTKDVDFLMDALVSANVANSYGSHDEQIAIIRDEILARVQA